MNAPDPVEPPDSAPLRLDLQLQALDGQDDATRVLPPRSEPALGIFALPDEDSFTLPLGDDVRPGPQTRTVGRYQIQGRIGKGGMAAVYRAHDPSIGRDVALKFLHAALSQDEGYRARFLREARAAGGLSHPHIVVVHDVGEIEHRPYMAMELVEGAPLAETLEHTPRLPVPTVVSIGIQLARALGYAHARGIVHRDIKPGNIMLLNDGQTIKVADFGIAAVEGGAPDDAALLGAVVGTPQYMSPEQARGDKVDGRSDLFSAGIVLYRLLTGERPFSGGTLVEVAEHIAGRDPVPLETLRPDVPASLRRVVDRCLAKQPAQRWQTGGDLADALLKVQAELDEAARRRHAPRIVPLRVKWAATMALVVAVVMGLTTFVVAQRQSAALMAQVAEYGESLARFIAVQNAAAVLGEEWEAVDVAVQEVMRTGSFDRVSVVDRAGTVRVSTQHALVGQPHRPAGERYEVQGRGVLNFEAPVMFQGKRVGLVALGIPEAPLTAVARLSATLMLVLLLVTVAAVAVAMYFVANWFARPIRLVREAMGEIAQGRYDHRIAQRRKDEFGQLYDDFDAMAQSLQRRESATTPAPASPQLPPGVAPAEVPEQPQEPRGGPPRP